jgi:hypothetical protein
MEQNITLGATEALSVRRSDGTVHHFEPEATGQTVAPPPPAKDGQSRRMLLRDIITLAPGDAITFDFSVKPLGLSLHIWRRGEKFPEYVGTIYEKSWMSCGSFSFGQQETAQVVACIFKAMLPQPWLRALGLAPPLKEPPPKWGANRV